ncbi:MAG: hypothetical protein NVV74_21910 [Magnetospirillum sp.]|nr:hypothetical protein [Magnetospirillum sp.]
MLRIEEIVGAMDDEFRYALEALSDERLEALAADKAALRRLRPVGVSHAEALAMIAAIQDRRQAKHQQETEAQQRKVERAARRKPSPGAGRLRPPRRRSRRRRRLAPRRPRWCCRPLPGPPAWPPRPPPARPSACRPPSCRWTPSFCRRPWTRPCPLRRYTPWKAGGATGESWRWPWP